MIVVLCPVVQASIGISQHQYFCCLISPPDNLNLDQTQNYFNQSTNGSHSENIDGFRFRNENLDVKLCKDLNSENENKYTNINLFE